MLRYFYDHYRYLNMVGILVVVGIAWFFSKKRSSINYWLVGKAFLVQAALVVLMLKISWGRDFLLFVSRGVKALYECADVGTAFVFGSLSKPIAPWGFIFALRVLPIIIFFGSIVSLLFYLGIIQKIVYGLNKIFKPLLGTSGPETLVAVGNSVLAQTEAPLLIKPYLPFLTPAQMMVVMVAGMGTLSMSIIAVYGAMGVSLLHLLSSSIISIPSSILIAKILYPDEYRPHSDENKKEAAPDDNQLGGSQNIFDAIAVGTTDGLAIVLQVAASLIVFVGFLALMNMILASVLGYFKVPVITIEQVFGYVAAPFGYLLGLQGDEIFQAGELLGLKVAANEMVAYSKMVTMHLSERANILITYMLCGFANFSSIGIQIAGIGALVPQKRALVGQLGLVAVLGGTLVNLLNAFLVGLIL